MGSIDHPLSLDIRPLRPDETDVVTGVLGLERLLQGNGRYLVAWADGEPLGHVHVALTEPPELQDLEVRPSHQRRGVATALIAAAEDTARAEGFDELRLEVSEKDPAAQTLYGRCGYVDTGLPARRVKGRIVLRTGPIEVDDVLLHFAKRLRP